MNHAFWRDKRVLVTGHTGFKGGWLCLWLHELGARVHGFALAPPTEPSLYQVADVRGALESSTIANLCDAAAINAAIATHAPQIVIHAAAQSLVLRSYAEPVETFATNVIGTVNLLDALRGSAGRVAVICITSDKCYAHTGNRHSFREDDPLGGNDPYSSSKACAELVAAAYRHSYFHDSETAVATVRAGNVIGGGDWAPNRLIPDILRAAENGETLIVRHPQAERPWQHVLDPLHGYLLLAERLYLGGNAYAAAWNLGPSGERRSVQWLVDYAAAHLPSLHWQTQDIERPPEAEFLCLDSSKARSELSWIPRWPLETTMERVLAWHAAWRRGADMRAMCLAQIADYLATDVR